MQEAGRSYIFYIALPLKIWRSKSLEQSDGGLREDSGGRKREFNKKVLQTKKLLRSQARLSNTCPNLYTWGQNLGLQAV
eukprot:6467815-Amphidinium_carterae.1